MFFCVAFLMNPPTLTELIPLVCPALKLLNDAVLLNSCLVTLYFSIQTNLKHRPLVCKGYAKPSNPKKTLVIEDIVAITKKNFN